MKIKILKIIGNIYSVIGTLILLFGSYEVLKWMI